MSENLKSISKEQFIDRLTNAITSKKKETFDELTQIGVIWFGEEELANILNKELPLKLETSKIPILSSLFILNNEIGTPYLLLNDFFE